MLTYFLGVLDAMIRVKIKQLLIDTFAGSLVYVAIKTNVLFLWNPVRILRSTEAPRNCPVHTSISNTILDLAI